MLMHWSLLNYAAVAKILKKHDKRTGLLLRAPCLTNVLQQVGGRASVCTCACMHACFAWSLRRARDSMYACAC